MVLIFFYKTFKKKIFNIYKLILKLDILSLGF